MFPFVPATADLLSEIISSSELVTMGDKELQSSVIRARHASHHGTIAINSLDAAAGMGSTDQYPCPECGARNATTRQQQIRGADEPMAVFIKCCECKNEWCFQE